MLPVIIYSLCLLLIFSALILMLFIRRSQQKTFAETYIENSTSGIIAIDNNENTVIYNQTAEDLFGILKAEVLGKPFNELVKKQVDASDSILLNTLRTGRIYQHVEAVITTSSGPLHVMAYTDLLKNSHGKTLGSLLCIRDVSDQKQLETQVYQSEKFDLIGEIAAGIANEVRNPLTSIQGLLQLMESKMSDKDTNRSLINIMLHEIHRLNITIGEFLLMSRPIVPIRRETDLLELLDEMLLQSEKELQDESITVTKAYSCELPHIFLDIEQIKHVIINIISNAISAMVGGGHLVVAATLNETNDTVTVAFTDNGCGMDALTADRIFEPFFTTRDSNTGLGLTVSKRIIHNHGGKIVLDSQPGLGTTCRIILPVKDVIKP